MAMKGLTITIPSTAEIFPIGSIYISVNTDNPANIFGGTWERIQDKFLVCSGSTYTNGSSGGSSSHIHSISGHVLTANQMPSHTHALTRQQWYNNDNVVSAYTYSIYSWKDGEGTGGNTSSSWSSPSARDIGWTGNGNSHTHGNTGSTSTLPPYLAIVVWKRTA